MKKYGLALVAASAIAATPAMAANVDYSSLTSSVDFDAVITAMLAVAAIVAAVLVARKGIRWILGAVK